MIDNVSTFLAGFVVLFVVFAETACAEPTDMEQAAQLQTRVLTLVKEGKEREALQVLDSAPKTFDSKSRLLVESTKAQIHAKLKNYNEVVRILQPFIDNDPHARLLGEELAVAFAEAGDYKSAFDYLRSYSRKLSLMGFNYEFERRLC